jgi:hypothetical protein
MKNKATRKIYRRNGITHMCCKGSYYAPITGETALKRNDEVQATFATLEDGTDVVHLFLPRHKKKGIRETWNVVVVPRKKRVEKEPSEYAQAQTREAEHQMKKAALKNAGMIVIAA